MLAGQPVHHAFHRHRLTVHGDRQRPGRHLRAAAGLGHLFRRPQVAVGGARLGPGVAGTAGHFHPPRFALLLVGVHKAAARADAQMRAAVSVRHHHRLAALVMNVHRRHGARRQAHANALGRFPIRGQPRLEGSGRQRLIAEFTGQGAFLAVEPHRHRPLADRPRFAGVLHVVGHFNLIGAQAGIKPAPVGLLVHQRPARLRVLAGAFRDRHAACGGLAAVPSRAGQVRQHALLVDS